VMRSVAAFSRPDSESQVDIDVVEALEASIQLVHNELRHHAHLERSYEAPPRVRGNAAKLGQVFVNLLSNAIQAVSDAGGHDHVIQVRAQRGPAGEAKVTISDTGPGIPPALLPRIFDPFFSTKPVGRGMGLGLAICHRLTAELNGTISVENGPGDGASFTVTLPGVSEVRASRQLEAPAEARKVHARTPTVLVIDDEPLMCDARDHARRQLRRDHHRQRAGRAHPAHARTVLRHHSL
jgi:C4-dicarboxylate-specific signal transduction histidine kinase